MEIQENNMIKKEPQYGIIAGILVGAYALVILLQFIVSAWLSACFIIVGAGLAAAGLIYKKAGILSLVGFGALTLVDLIMFVRNLFSVFRLFNFGFTMILNWMLNMLSGVLVLAGTAATLFALATLFTNFMPAGRGIVAKLWFVPAACIAAAAVIVVPGIVLNGAHIGLYFILGRLAMLSLAGGSLFAVMWCAKSEPMPVF